MTDKLSHNIKNLKFILLLILSIEVSRIDGQENISGVINKYGKVTSIGAGYVIIGDLTQAQQFNAGDYVLLIQMHGVGIQTIQGSYGVNVQSVFGTPGGYEFMIIQSVNTTTGRIDFTRNVYNNTYDINSNLQLVQVPFYNAPVVIGTLTCTAWNSTNSIGGVLAFMAARKVTLNADIDVTGMGFNGAPGVAGIGECVYANEAANGLDSYPLSWDDAGLKGEGVAIHDASGNLLYPDHAKGQGRNFTGGGGGNGWFSGGGGGSNRGKGADGGLEKFVSGQCGNDPRDGGYGGMNIIGTVIQSGLFLGGGGGASTQASGSTASSGGNGGGIVIIVADSIDAKNHNIRLNGSTAANAISDAGAGGGGAGGSVALSFQGYSSPLQISSNGGNGGTNPGGFGEGGGGGGGLIWFSSASVPSSASGASVACGTPGPTILAEGVGEIRYNYRPSLNGFLFNMIHSARTGNGTDSVCSNILYGQISGTQPVGGTSPYTYQWESSTTSATAGFSAAAGTINQQNYTPPALLTQTTWFRRTVADYTGSITDVSLPVMIIVQPYIKNNSVGNQDTVCYGQSAPQLHSLLALQDGNGTYSYSWESSTDSVSFISVGVTSQNYQPPSALTQTTWYRRTVNSGACVNTSASVRISVLDTLKNNTILSLPQEICYGTLFSDLSATSPPTLSGGDNTYRYRWENGSDESAWTTATGTSDGVNYDPSESASYFPGQQYFRRVVFSGNNNVCKNISNSVLLSDYAVITNNSITSGDQTICSGSTPAQLTGSIPLNGKGAGSYTYTWQDSSKSHTWTDITGYVNVASQNYTPAALTDTTSYRRIVYSSACNSTSQSVTIKVHKPVTGNTISLSGGFTDTTLCSGGIPHRFTGSQPSGGTNIPGDYTYQWSTSPDNSTWSDISASGENIDYQPGSMASTAYFRRMASSGYCFSFSVPIKVTILPSITNNAVTGSQTVCKGNTPDALVQDASVSLSGGAGTGSYSFLWEQSNDGALWTPASGTNNSSEGTYQPPVMTRSVEYRRKVKSGDNDCCSSTSNILELTLDSLAAGTKINAGNDTSIYSFDYIIQLAAEPAFAGGAGKWSLVEGTGNFENDTQNNTKATGLSKGTNKFLWTVTKGACKLEDTVEVDVYNMIVPEGFSPNNDPQGYNNTFEIKGLDLPNQNAELTIINGAGDEVFKTSNRNGEEWKEWDGKNSRGTDLPEGTYYYLLRIFSKGNSMVFKKSGFVILKRY